MYFTRKITPIFSLIAILIAYIFRNSLERFFVIQGIFIVMGIAMSGSYYIVNGNTIRKYFYGILTNTIDISKIDSVQIVNVKQIGSIDYPDIRSGRFIDGFFLIMSNGTKQKMHLDYTNRNGVELGDYLIKERNKRVKYRVIKKWFNDIF
jgi:hypothetical protein